MTVQKASRNIFKRIPITQIDRPDDIARMEIHDGELQELANSIAERGLMQPIGVTPRAGRFMIVYGDRRFLAHKLLSRKNILCRVEEISDDQVVIDRAMENVQRVNLTPVEEGQIYKGLYEKAGMSIDEICSKVGKSQGMVQRRIDILRMPASFQKALHEKTINLSVAEELWSCPDQARREYFLELAVEHGITKNIARNWVQEYKKEKRAAETPGGNGGGLNPIYEETPIYRSCDACKGPVEYKDLKELRICLSCFQTIIEALKNNH